MSLRVAILQELGRAEGWRTPHDVAVMVTWEGQALTTAAAGALLRQLAGDGLAELDEALGRYRAAPHLTVAELARRLRCSTRTVRREIASGRLEAVRVRGRVRIPLAAIEAAYPSRPAPPPGRAGGEAAPARPTPAGPARRAPVARVLSRVRRRPRA